MTHPFFTIYRDPTTPPAPCPGPRGAGASPSGRGLATLSPAFPQFPECTGDLTHKAGVKGPALGRPPPRPHEQRQRLLCEHCCRCSLWPHVLRLHWGAGESGPGGARAEAQHSTAGAGTADRQPGATIGRQLETKCEPGQA